MLLEVALSHMSRYPAYDGQEPAFVTPDDREIPYYHFNPVEGDAPREAPQNVVEGRSRPVEDEPQDEFTQVFSSDERRQAQERRDNTEALRRRQESRR